MNATMPAFPTQLRLARAASPRFRPLGLHRGSHCHVNLILQNLRTDLWLATGRRRLADSRRLQRRDRAFRVATGYCADRPPTWDGPRSDDNSRWKVRNVRGDSSASRRQVRRVRRVRRKDQPSLWHHRSKRSCSENMEIMACAVALIDRLTHHAEIVAIDGESYRKREAEPAQTRKQEQKPKR